MSLSSKNKNSKNQKEKDSLQSAGDTFFDSLHNSKLNGDSSNEIISTNKKQNNFYLALKCMNGPMSDTLLLGTSEFSEINPNQTKEENISRYLHHPIIKEINKEGNKIIRIKPRQNYGSIVNRPYTSKYNNMKNVFKDILMSVKEIKLNENVNLNIYKKNDFYNFSSNVKETKIFHKKNNSSISNQIYNNNNNIVIGKKNNNSIKNIRTNGNKNNKSNQVNSTTVTKENNNINIIYDVNDIKKQIKYDDKLEDLEESNDIDIKNYIIKEENKNFVLNDDSNISSLKSIKGSKDKIGIELQKNSSCTKKDEILVIDSINEKNKQKTTTIKKLRKKYERTEFKSYIYNTNPHLNRYVYDNQDINKELILNRNRKRTEELNYRKSKKSKSGQYIDYNFISKNKIRINSKNFSELEDSLSQLSNNINKNLLDNFNNCGNFKNNEFLMRYRNGDYKNYELNNNQNLNNNKKSHKNSNQFSPPAELLDFISNKSDNNLNNNSNHNDNIEINNNNYYNYNINFSGNNTFIIKNNENKFDGKSENSYNMQYEKFVSKSDLKKKQMSQSQTNPNYDLSSSNNEYYDNENENEYNDFYDFVTPTKNPEAIMRQNFSLISPFYPKKKKRNKSNNFYINSNEKKNICHSYTIKLEKIPYKKELSIISENSANENDISNSGLSKKISKRRNTFFIKENKEKILNNSFVHSQPETIYDLTFYKNLIENSQKIKKINYKDILKNQKKISWQDRLHTMVWMMQICEEFAFKRDTFHYACNYFDNYLTFGKEKIKNAKMLQLIGITCISISGKIEEVQIPKLKEYANSIDESFNIKDIIDMEQKVCLSLGWKLINVNINTWLNWYICQWDLYIDSVDDIKQQLLTYINEDEIIYYKKSNDNSYYNYRKICQIIDMIALDYFSYKFEPRILMAVSLFIIICINYNLDYNFIKKNFKQKTSFTKYLFEVYNQFINQSFDFSFNDENFQNAIVFCYKFKNFNFTYELPLLYQIHQNLLENGNYEDFISYQTTNDNIEEFLKEIIVKRNKKDNSEKTKNTTNNDKNKFSSNKKSNDK